MSLISQEDYEKLYAPNYEHVFAVVDHLKESVADCQTIIDKISSKRVVEIPICEIDGTTVTFQVRTETNNTTLEFVIVYGKEGESKINESRMNEWFNLIDLDTFVHLYMYDISPFTQNNKFDVSYLSNRKWKREYRKNIVTKWDTLTHTEPHENFDYNKLVEKINEMGEMTQKQRKEILELIEFLDWKHIYSQAFGLEKEESWRVKLFK